MIVELNELLKSMKGNLGEYHIYQDCYGNIVLRRNPRKSTVTEKQREARRKFAAKYKGDWRKRKANLVSSDGDLPKE